MHGEGTLTTFSNNIATEYKGIWVNNELSAGTISYLNENGILIDSYKGDIISGKKEGEGVYQWGSGLKFEGSFKNDQIKGQGALIGRDFKLKGTFDSSDNTPLQVGGSLRSTIQY